MRPPRPGKDLLTARALNAIDSAARTYGCDPARLSDAEWRRLRGVGKRTVAELHAWFHQGSTGGASLAQRHAALEAVATAAFDFAMEMQDLVADHNMGPAERRLSHAFATLRSTGWKP